MAIIHGADLKVLGAHTVTGAATLSGGLLVSGALSYENVISIPIIEHIHVNCGVGNLNTTNSSGQQTVKIQTLSGYTFVARGTAVTVNIEGYWFLGGNNVSNGGMTFGPGINGVFDGNNPYYPSIIGYGYNVYSSSSGKFTVTKGATYQLSCIYQAVGDTGINRVLYRGGITAVCTVN